MKSVNPNASKEVCAVLEFLEKIKGNSILLGQHTQTVKQEELTQIEKVTGKLPALCGFELLSYSPNINLETCDNDALTEVLENRNTLEKAFEWAEKGGLLTFTWHWFSPIGGRDKSFFSRNTDFDAQKVLEQDTEERKAFFSDLDAMAELLEKFQEKSIPILWRPFHEAEGDWFWWGAKGMDTARQLYRLMFDYFTNVKKLNNLVWVWNNPRPEGYVGDEYCDVISRDLYPPEHQHTSLEKELAELKAVTPTSKLCAVGEIGTIPDVEALLAKKLEWLWFMTWSKVFCLTEKFTTNEMLNKTYSLPNAITLDKLNEIKSW